MECGLPFATTAGILNVACENLRFPRQRDFIGEESRVQVTTTVQVGCSQVMHEKRRQA